MRWSPPPSPRPKTFDEWAGEHNIKLDESNTITKRKPQFRWVYAATALLLVVAVILPIILKKSPNPIEPEPPIPKTYSSQDIIPQWLTLDELYQVDNILLFESGQILRFNRIDAEYSIDEEHLLLRYYMENCLIATSDETNAFYVNYSVRLYHNYLFNNYEKFLDLNSSMKIGETEISYKIENDHITLANDKSAHLNFLYENKEYFLEVQGFEDVTEITEETLKILLNDLFSLQERGANERI